jgi:hypothetical protein
MFFRDKDQLTILMPDEANTSKMMCDFVMILKQDI